MAEGQWGELLQRHPYRVKISWLQGASMFQTGFHVRSAGVEVGDAQEVADGVWGWVNTNFRTLLTPQNRMVGVDVVDLVTREGGVVSPAGVFGTADTSEEGKVPGFLAAVVALKSAKRVRYGQGRMFFPIVGEAALTAETLSVAAQASYQGVINALAAEFTGNDVTGYNLINVHGILPPKAATPTTPARPEIPASWYDVVSLRLNIATTFLRSRKAGVGS